MIGTHPHWADNLVLGSIAVCICSLVVVVIGGPLYVLFTTRPAAKLKPQPTSAAFDLPGRLLLCLGVSWLAILLDTATYTSVWESEMSDKVDANFYRGLALCDASFAYLTMVATIWLVWAMWRAHHRPSSTNS